MLRGRNFVDEFTTGLILNHVGAIHLCPYVMVMQMMLYSMILNKNRKYL